MSSAANEASPPVPAARRATVAAASFAVAPGSVAPVGRRVAAFALDLLLALVVVGVGYAVVAAVGASPGDLVLALPLVLGIGVGVGQWIAEARTGATVGNALTGIRTLSASTGRPAGLLAVLVRQLVVGVGALVCAVGQWIVVASGAWDRTPAQQGWHDKAARTVVLRAGAVRRQGTSGPARSVPWDSAVARAVGPSLVSAAPSQGARLPASDPVGLIPLVPVFATAPLAPAPAPAPDAPASAPTWAVPVLPEAAAAPPVPVIRAVPDDDGTEQADAADPHPPLVATVIDIPPGPVTAAPQALHDPAPALIESPEAGVPHQSAGPDLHELEHTRLRTSAPRGAVAGLRLLFDTGEQVDVTGEGLIGRNPGPEAGAHHVVAIDDPERSISKVHLAFGLEPDGRLWVMDRGSTNGTVVVGPDGRSAALVAGSRATVASGWTVRFGRRSVQVTGR
ncbi:RDD family protein [Cellulomonas sp. Leaf395]|uniref:RDD family protein n=1 Tax=Cellulomonas sp. Leaf395 TaxID=1736362 RepID=UPI0006FE41FE|nr:RDD family protein [Cellulomonas sp. Leaf395]KQS99475.1 hypothetical protein ASG23_08820 [Cellulomonas sp. Leaf395]